MTQSRQALRTRIKSVNSTRKITRAMEMIANAKLFKQRTKMEANRDYATRLQETVNEIVSCNPDAESIYMKKNDAETVFTIVFGSDLGLCGGYNANVLKEAEQNLKKEDPCILIGTSLYHEMTEKGFHLVNETPISSDKLDFSILRECVAQAVDAYLDGKAGKVQVLYTRFVNTMTFMPAIDQLLPCDVKAEVKKQDDSHVETLFEPDAETILNQLIPMMITDVAYSNWMESTTAEQGSRRMAMKTATDNANDLADELQLAYNKARQAAITQEITEIVGGSSAV